MGMPLRRQVKPYGTVVARFVEDERKLRVLIVDDEPPIRRTVRRLLGKDFLAFLEASDLDQARDALNCHTPPDVVVLDLALRTEHPEEGFAFLRAIREEISYRPVVVLTGRADVKIAVEAMHLGAIDVIEKGEGADRVREAVRRALELVIANRLSQGVGSVKRARDAVDDDDSDPRPPQTDPFVDDIIEAISPADARRMKPLEHYVDEIKRQVVAEAIARSRGNLTDAARVLQMKRGNFHRLAVRLGLHEPTRNRDAESGKQKIAPRSTREDPSDDEP